MNLFDALKVNGKAVRNVFPTGDNNPSFRHGLSKHPLYRIFYGMKRRCSAEKDPAFKNYGARGIIVCHEWVNSFQSFFDWAMNNGYQHGLEIDRIDVNSSYSPDNCRFVTRLVQANNKRNNINFTEDGKTMTLAQWCREKNLNYKLVKDRVGLGHSVRDALYGTHQSANKGSNVYCSRLTEDQVKFILANKGIVSQSKLGTMFNVSGSTIYKIQKGTKWKHISQNAA